MIKGQIITIIPSIPLSEMRLTPLVGRQGKLIEANLKQKSTGWWVELIGEEFLNEHEWFIPMASISTL